MSEVNEMHRRAMELAEQAVAARLSGDPEGERRLLREAFEVERAAAILMIGDLGVEPTRSVLFRSAAALALDAGLTEEATRMADLGLGGGAPEPIRSELIGIRDEAAVAQHMELRGIELLPNALQFSMWKGLDVGHGFIRSKELTKRVDKVDLIARRLLAEKAGVEFQENSPLPKGAVNSVETYVSTGRAQSYAFTVRVGTSQMGLFGNDPSVDVVRTMLDVIDAVNEGDEEALGSLLPDDSYRRNLVAQVRDLAPDGKHVGEVGITALDSEGAIRQIRLNERRDLIPKPPKPPEHREEEVGDVVELRGEMQEAKARNRSVVTLVEGGRATTIHVPRGMLHDIVRPYFLERVVVVARKEARRLVLEDIRPEET